MTTDTQTPPCEHGDPWCEPCAEAAIAADRKRTKLGGLQIPADASPYSYRPGELLVQRGFDLNGATVTRLVVRGLMAHAYVFPRDPITHDHRVLIVDDYRCGDPHVVDTRIPVTVIGVELLTEGLLRGYATAMGVDVATSDPTSDPARWENGDWKTCSLHGGAITQDCLCDPGMGLGDLDAAQRLLADEVFSCRAVLAPGELAREVIEAYHGIKARRPERATFTFTGDHTAVEDWASAIVAEHTGRIQAMAVFGGDYQGIYIDPERLASLGLTSRYTKSVMVPTGGVVEWTGTEFIARWRRADEHQEG